MQETSSSLQDLRSKYQNSLGKQEESSRVAVAYDFWITEKNVPLAYRPEFKIDYKTGQALFQILRLGIMPDLGYETVVFVW